MTHTSPNLCTEASDGEILADFARHGRQEAFAIIVRRHGGLVIGVCRSVLGNGADAEDAAQAVFLTLAQKAGSLQGHKTAVGWLHRVAWYVAARAAEAQAIRRRHEQEAARMRPETGTGEPEIPGERLHAAINELPEAYRIPLLLHYVEGRTEAETAALMGCKESAASMRLTRGRKMLRERLVKRGVAVSVAAVTMGTAGHASAGVPAAFVDSTANVAASVVSGIAASAAASATVAALSKGAMNMMFWWKLKVAACVVIGIFLLAGAGGAYYVSARGPMAPTATAAAPRGYTIRNFGPALGRNEQGLLSASGQVVLMLQTTPPPAPAPAAGVRGRGAPAFAGASVTHHAFFFEGDERVDLGSLGGARVWAYAMNAAGQIAGTSEMPSDDPPGPGRPLPTHAYLYADGKMQDLGTLGGRGSNAAAINAAGQVVGRSFVPGALPARRMQGRNGTPDIHHAFLFEKGKMQDLGTLGGYMSQALAINARGDVVGESEIAMPANAPAGNDPLHAFLWREGKMTDLGTLGGTNSRAVAINDKGDVAGHADVDLGVILPGAMQAAASSVTRHAFIYSGGKMQSLGNLGGRMCTVVGINAGGQIAGYADIDLGKPRPTGAAATPQAMSDSYPTFHAFISKDGKLHDLGGLPGRKYSEATAINNMGQVVGRAMASMEATDSRGFLYSDGKMVDLNEFVGEAKLAAAGVKMIEGAKAINDRGQILCWGVDNGGMLIAVLVSPEDRP